MQTHNACEGAMASADTDALPPANMREEPGWLSELLGQAEKHIMK